MNDKSAEIWSDIANKTHVENLGNYMFNDSSYNRDDQYTTLKLIKGSGHKILDFGFGLGRNATYLKQHAFEIHGCDLPKVVEKYEAHCDIKYDKIFTLPNGGLSKELMKEKYDVIVVSFVFQVMYDVKYFRKLIKQLARITDNIHVINRVCADGGWNIYKELMGSPDVSLLVGDGQDVGFLTKQKSDSSVHFEAVFSSNCFDINDSTTVEIESLDRGMWVYKSYNEVFADAREWSANLPKLKAICGVPRSGLAIGAHLAHHLNIPFYSIEGLCHNLYYKPNNCRPTDDNDGKILVVDDTVWSGQAMSVVRDYFPDHLRKEMLFGAMYVNQEQVDLVDVFYKILPTINHTFEWNIMRDPLSSKYMVDLDGVLSEDWLSNNIYEEELSRYISHLKYAQPLVKPLFQLYKIVTARFEKWRPETERWLERNNIRYHELIMSPYSTIEERLENNGFGEWKAELYEKDSFAECFIESCPTQAKQIHVMTSKPVFCFSEKKPFGNFKF